MIFLEKFLQKFLFKIAKEQYKKNQLNESVKTLCQLIIIKNNILNNIEMKLLFKVLNKKISFIYKFYEEITDPTEKVNNLFCFLNIQIKLLTNLN